MYIIPNDNSGPKDKASKGTVRFVSAPGDPAAQRAEMRCREVGCGDGTDGKLRAYVWYQLDEAGEFIEALL